MNDVYGALLDCGLLPLFYNADVKQAAEVARACQRGGAQLIEFTDRGENALSVFQTLRQQDLGLLLGVGSVQQASSADAYIKAGAEFVVGPGFDPATADRCAQDNIPYIPGCSTPTEMMTARRAGAQILKLFPADALGGPRYIRAVLAPLQDYKLMPTGGVYPDRDAVYQWIGAGAACLGMGSGLLRSRWIEAGRFDQLEKAVHNVITWVDQARHTLL